MGFRWLIFVNDYMFELTRKRLLNLFMPLIYTYKKSFSNAPKMPWLNVGLASSGLLSCNKISWFDRYMSISSMKDIYIDDIFPSGVFYNKNNLHFWSVVDVFNFSEAGKIRFTRAHQSHIHLGWRDSSNRITSSSSQFHHSDFYARDWELINRYFAIVSHT